jgi:uncharacterized membrane protein
MRSGLLLVGLIFLVVGIGLTASLIGAIIGIPIGFIGFIMILVGLFSSGKQNITIQQTVSGDRKGSSKDKDDDNDAVATLKMRYAKGDISKKEYLEMKKDLEK